MVDKITKTSTKTIGGHRTCPENMEKNKQISDLPSGFWPLASCGAPACTWWPPVAHPEGEVAAASAYLRFRGLILTQHHRSAAISLGAGILFRAVTTTPMERKHGKERNMSQPDTDTAAQSPSSQQGTADSDGWPSEAISEQMNQPAQTSQSESSHDGKDEHALHTNLKRGMESRHLQMISLGGVIGTGLFLSSGYTIQQAGPIGTILAYSIGALIVYLVMLTLGELSVAMPVTGSFHVYAEKFIGPGTGFVIAIQYWLTWTVALGSEFTAAGLLMQRWFPDSPTWVWSAACIILIFTLNALSVRLFAEAEFCLPRSRCSPSARSSSSDRSPSSASSRSPATNMPRCSAISSRTASSPTASCRCSPRF